MTPIETKPSILQIASQHIVLRRAGREFVGLCPFHQEKHPSLTVNESKGLFYCHGCGAGGDVIRFVEMIERLDFKGALALLGVERQARPSRAEVVRRDRLRRKAAEVTQWALAASAHLAGTLREIGQWAHLARRVLRNLGKEADRSVIHAEIERCGREWAILEGWHDDLSDPDGALELYRNRQCLEGVPEILE